MLSPEKGFYSFVKTNYFSREKFWKLSRLLEGQIFNLEGMGRRR